MTAVERILEYTVLTSEKLEIGDRKVDDNWPQNGKIIFENVSFRYEYDLPDVLKELSFTINPGEKIGIVGRTGAGKSSIIQTLFRMAEPNGNIYIDNINIKEISLHDLRKKLSIIPVIIFLYFFNDKWKINMIFHFVLARAYIIYWNNSK